jgi:uncharacterized membrane protein
MKTLRRLITSRRCVKRNIGFCTLCVHMHRIHRLKLGGGWFCQLLYLTLEMGVLCMLMRLQHRNGGWIWLLEPVYINSLSRLDHVSHFETSVIGASLADYARTQMVSFLHKMLHVWHPCYLLCYSVLLSPCVRGIWQARLIVLLRWISPLLYLAASWHEASAYAGFICFRCEEDGPWRWCFKLSY